MFNSTGATDVSIRNMGLESGDKFPASPNFARFTAVIYL